MRGRSGNSFIFVVFFCYVFSMGVCLFSVMLSVHEMENKGREGQSGEILPGNVKLEVGEAHLGVPTEIWLPKSLENRCRGEERQLFTSLS